MIAGGACLVYCVVEVLLGVWWHAVRTSTTDVCCSMKTLWASSCQHLRLCRSAFPSSLTTFFKWTWRRCCGVNTSWILVSFEVVLYSVDLAWAACALYFKSCGMSNYLPVERKITGNCATYEVVVSLFIPPYCSMGVFSLLFVCLFVCFLYGYGFLGGGKR